MPTRIRNVRFRDLMSFGLQYWLSRSAVPKLFISGEPGQVVRGRVAEALRGWNNQTEVTVQGRKLLQEDSPDAIGSSIAQFVRWLGR